MSPICGCSRKLQLQKNGAARRLKGLESKLGELEREKQEYQREIESSQGNFENSVEVGTDMCGTS